MHDVFILWMNEKVFGLAGLCFGCKLGSGNINIGTLMGFDFQKLGILVVEDTEPMRNLMVSVLGTLGVGKVFTASNGALGFDLFCRENPDIVITDWHMEPVSGLELVEKIRGHSRSPNKTVPIIMMSGYSAFPRIFKARDTGVTEFLVKPFSASDLARRLAYVINKPRDFVQAPDYFGPDRRRRLDAEYAGEKKRAMDERDGDDDKFLV